MVVLAVKGYIVKMVERWIHTNTPAVKEQSKLRVYYFERASLKNNFELSRFPRNLTVGLFHGCP